MYDSKYETQLIEKTNKIESLTINNPDLDEILINTSDDSVNTQSNLEESTNLENEKIDNEILNTTENDQSYISSQMVDMYIMANKKYFNQDKILMIRDKLSKMTEEQYILLSTVEFKDPTMMLIISIFVGGLGIDRFMLGETGMGILKLLTCGCCGILTIIDWFTISKKVKEINTNKFMML